MPSLMYKPETWVHFKLGSAEAVGKIQGAILNKDQWIYYITNAAAKDNTYTVVETDIIETIQ